MQVAKLRPEHHGIQSFQVSLEQTARVVTPSPFPSNRLHALSHVSLVLKQAANIVHSFLFPSKRLHILSPSPFPAVCPAMKPGTCLLVLHLPRHILTAQGLIASCLQAIFSLFIVDMCCTAAVLTTPSLKGSTELIWVISSYCYLPIFVCSQALRLQRQGNCFSQSV